MYVIFKKFKYDPPNLEGRSTITFQSVKSYFTDYLKSSRRGMKKAKIMFKMWKEEQKKQKKEKL